MKAIIFAAGKGTRLQPLTNSTPKALVKVNGITLLEHVVKHLKFYGVNDIIINVHYLGNKIIDFLKTNNNFGINIVISDESQELLETGGGLLKAAHFFKDSESFIAYNVDVLSDINLKEMIDKHKSQRNLATLAVRKRQSSRYFLFDIEKRLIGWKNTLTGEEIFVNNKKEAYDEMAFSGIHIISTKIFDLINKSGSFSITPIYIELAKKYSIKAFDHSETQWFDIGKHETLKNAELNYKSPY